MRYFMLLVLLASSAILVDCLHEVSIDCGFSGDYVYFDDRTHKIYAPDAEYIDTGANHEIDESYVTGQPEQAQNLRSFPDGVRNCYTINDVTQGDKYLIRASFLYGYYDGGQQMREIITLASSDYFSICLVKSGDGIPFISALELRQLNSELYKDVNQSVSFRLSERKSMGLDQTIRFPDDIYDRIWQPGYTSCVATYYCRDVRQNSTVLTTTALVELGSDDAYKVPSAIMQSAAVSSDNNTLILSLSNGDDVVMAPMFYVYLHFAELRAPKGTESSIFQLRVPGSRPRLINISLEYLVARHIQLIYQANSDPSTFYLNLTRVPGSLPPLLNAMEAYYYVNVTTFSTDQGDVDAMMTIKRLLYHTEWQGDPCVPVQFAWNETKCSFPISTPPRVTSLDLFNRGLKGDIPAAIGNLSAITYLNLSRNTFTGPIPPFLANLNSLQTLDLSGNQLDGLVPIVLCNRQANGSLRLRLEDNPCYFQGICVCSKRKQKHHIHVLAISIVVAAVTVIVLLSVFFLRGKRGKKEPSKRQPKWRDTIGSSFHTGSPHFTYQDLRTITNNFERVIGKGGFGTVYYGRLHDGTEVAVKMQKRFLAIEEGISEDFMTEELGSDSHGIKEFQVEAQLLSRVHHRNLVALVGYCKDGHSLGLVFEYAAQGSLKDHLSDKNNTGRVLSWRERLRIAVDAAQGLEYLHKGCKPPIIHRDVKTSNILLSHNFEAKIADFGLSKAFLTDAQTHVSTQAVVGTPGYVDPDYHSTYRLTEKSDVYSFGIVLLELVTGLPAVLKFLETGHIIQWVRQGLAQGTVADVVDPRLQQQQQCDMYSVRRVVDLALHCTALNSNERPTMTEVVMQLKESLQLEIVSESSTRPYGGDVDVNQSGTTATTSINLTELSDPSAR
ncbi:LRR receptor-like serine/threonine-protein kinase IOS1 isoform X2 [Musa acuminata AAA Group]|uniref:LRR receptor-like serine/threonine-protein kinase IOS1 isoform X2 n=1 Tax=Musa acuminata AAA Group TaxID=214697 RepID=UPI0031D24221